MMMMMMMMMMNAMEENRLLKLDLYIRKDMKRNGIGFIQSIASIWRIWMDVENDEEEEDGRR